MLETTGEPKIIADNMSGWVSDERSGVGTGGGAEGRGGGAGGGAAGGEDAVYILYCLRYISIHAILLMKPPKITAICNAIYLFRP